MDETWVHHFDPEMKSSSMQWKTPSSPTPKKARVEPLEWFESHPKSYYAQGLLKVTEGPYHNKVAEMCRYAG